ncbi:hypothetical protein SISNIDRAFT_545737 [Sistotremastrum niveocremeum HHB9708]|uniref:DUF6533 domain-containing protein n=1 Tax=Sistotremastrum niveocremeum HHB9708 TaxID=1314777 RepID=A0A165AEE8_9AGAM|nr:hypothetical protein SISNIDRAFT_545737 [Sistotremastrum niveocremeum HHB9708]
MNWDTIHTIQLLLASKHSIHASFTVLMWDHIITLDQEVTRIWKQPWNGGKLLFLLNRYLSPTQYLLQLFALDLPAFSGPRCPKVYRLSFATAVYATAIAEFILILRTYALYNSSKRVLVFLLLMFGAHIMVMIMAVIHASPYPLPQGITGCTLTGKGLLYVFFWVTPWIADSIILVLTLWKIGELRRHSPIKLPLIHVLARDGILWYGVIVAIDTINVLIYLLCPSGVKPMGGAFCETCMTIMISRLQLNLRAPEVVYKNNSYAYPDATTVERHGTNLTTINTIQSYEDVANVGSRRSPDRWLALSTVFRGTTASLGAHVDMDNFALAHLTSARGEDYNNHQGRDEIELRSIESGYRGQIVVGPPLKD